LQGQVERKNKLLQQKKILEAQAKAKAREDFQLHLQKAGPKPKLKRPLCVADPYSRLEGYKPSLLRRGTADSAKETTGSAVETTNSAVGTTDSAVETTDSAVGTTDSAKETTDSAKEKTVRRHVTSLLLQPHHRLLPYSDDAPYDDPRGKKIHPMLQHRANSYTNTQLMRRALFSQNAYQTEFDRLKAKDAKRKEQRQAQRFRPPPSVSEDESVEATEAEPSTSTSNEVDVEAARVQPSAPILQSVAIQTVEAQPSTSVTNEVEVEAVRVQPSTSVPNDTTSVPNDAVSVPNDATSEVVNTQIPVSVSDNVIVEATNAQPSTPKDVSVESGRHYSPMDVDVSGESGRHYSPMDVDVSMESAENVLLSPVPPPTVAAGPLPTSSLRAGRVRSRNNIAPYAVRSGARSPAEGDGSMSDRDREMAMLEEAAKNVPVLNLPTNLNFTENVGYSSASDFFKLTSVPRCSTVPRLPESPTPDHFHTRHLEYRLPREAPLPVYRLAMVLPVPISILPFLSKILQIHSGTVIRRLRTLKICRSVNKLMLQPVLYLMVVSHLCLISQYCIYRLTVNNPSSSHVGASELALSNDSDQDYQMDVSPPDNRSTSNGFNVSNTPVAGSQPFGQSFGQTPQRAEGFQPSTPAPMGQHSGWPASNNSFTPGFFASVSNQSTPVPPPVFAGPSSGVPFEASARGFNPN